VNLSDQCSVISEQPSECGSVSKEADFCLGSGVRKECHLNCNLKVTNVVLSSGFEILIMVMYIFLSGLK